MNRKIITNMAAMVVAAATLGACSSSSPTVAPTLPTPSPMQSSIGPLPSASVVTPAPSVPSFYSLLPDNIKAKHGLDMAFSVYPPFTMYASDNKTNIGASVDIAKELEQRLGVPVNLLDGTSLVTIITGIPAGRYDGSIGPIGDTLKREQTFDFVNYTITKTNFLVKNGNPASINSLGDICGKKIGVEAGGVAETKANAQSDQCVKDGKQAASVMTLGDQPAMVLAVMSGQIDAMYSGRSTLLYYQSLQSSDLQVTGDALDSSIGGKPTYQGMMFPKGSPLSSVLVKALQSMWDDGTYQTIMAKWNLTTVELSGPMMNKGY